MTAPMTKRRVITKVRWDADRVKALRLHMKMTQQVFADRLNVRQQTVSEWEKALYQPRGASVALLNIVAEQAGFKLLEAEVAQK